MSGIILAFDFGIKNIGVAIGQYVTGTANLLDTIKIQNSTPNWMLIKNLIHEWQPDTIIVGLPLNIDGTEQLLTKYAKNFANEIRNYFHITVNLHDERLSTIEARSILFKKYGFQALLSKKGKIHSASAAIILESYLAFHR